MRTPNVDILRFFFADHDTISLAQANAGLVDPATNSKVRIVRVAPLVSALRNEGWTIGTGRDAAGNAFYRVDRRPSEPVTSPPTKLQPLREEARQVKEAAGWRCSKAKCWSHVIPDPDVTQFDSRYTTGRCTTHGKVVLVRANP
jgi:hypothetical protein